MSLPKLYGSCGATLELPYPENVNGPFHLADIIYNFPGVLQEPKILKYLFNCPKVTSGPIDISTVLLEASKECVHEMIDDEIFCGRRKECFSINRSSDNFVKQVQSFSKQLEPVKEVVQKNLKSIAASARPKYSRNIVENLS